MNNIVLQKAEPDIGFSEEVSEMLWQGCIDWFHPTAERVLMNQETSTAVFFIRKAQKSDVPLIMSFIKELALYEKLSYEVVATEESLTETLFQETSSAEVLLAYCNDEPVGFALYFHNYSTFLGKPGIYLEDLFILEEHRGKGVGRELLKHLARVAKERNCGRMEWWVLDWNTPAIEFYKSLGAVPMNDWTTFRVTGEALDRLALND